MSGPETMDHRIRRADAIINRLFGIGLDLNSLRSRIDGPYRHRLDFAIQSLDLAISEVRALAVSANGSEQELPRSRTPTEES